MKRAAMILVAAVLLVVDLTGCSSGKTATVPGPTTTVAGPTVTKAGPTVTVTATKTVSPSTGQVSPEACANLSYGSDGDFGPAVCPDGRANLAAVDALRAAGWVTIDLDPAATPEQVTAALCEDNKTLTNPLRLTLWTAALAVNRWKFAVPPVDQSGNFTGSCN